MSNFPGKHPIVSKKLTISERPLYGIYIFCIWKKMQKNITRWHKDEICFLQHQHER